MDSFQLILAALKVGTQATKNPRLHGIAHDLRARIQTVLSPHVSADAILSQFIASPDTGEKPLIDALQVAGIDQDVLAVQMAQQLLELSQSQTMWSPESFVTASGSRAVGIGGNVSNSLIVTGDNAVINYPDSAKPGIVAFHEPELPTYFRGRTQEIEQVLNLVQNRRKCGLFAIDGSGKTALAAAVAREARASNVATVVWLEVNNPSQVDLVLQDLARSVGVNINAIPGHQQPAYLRGVTANRGLLVIFDNVNDDQAINELLDAVGPGNAILITGRDSSLPVLTRYSVEPIEVGPLPTEDAVAVLLAVAGRSLAVPPSHLAWRDLATAVGNLPLALEIIAASVRSRLDRNPENYLKEQVETGQWISTGKGIAQLQQALRASVQQLNPDYIHAFACLGVFAGQGFSAEAVTTVCQFDSEDSAEQFLSVLRDLMLIGQGANELFFTLHPVVRQFAYHMLAELEIDPKAKRGPLDRYIIYYWSLTGKWAGYEKKPYQLQVSSPS